MFWGCVRDGTRMRIVAQSDELTSMQSMGGDWLTESVESTVMIDVTRGYWSFSRRAETDGH